MKDTNIKGYYTGKTIITPEGTFTIGKISGWNGYGVPVYDTWQNGKKVGTLNNKFIHKYLREQKHR